ncbi:MAG: bifunctional riboflavin kinase/FAD synthetase [Gammaproteobacteria bacterium]|nr:bifunctional riboflavin kinase/FAD synthetase [Gammaproteobacteria bacterium]
MILVEDASGFSRKHGRCVATIGKFDGVHLGHQLILDQLKGEAREKDLPALVIVIEPHPEEFFAGSGGDCPARLMDKQEKLRLLEEYGVDFCFVLRFDAEMSRMSAEAWVRDILVDGLGVAALIAGEDFRFGHRRTGDFGLLEREGREFDFSVHRTLTREVEGMRVSSTLVRQKLAQDDFAMVEKLLGRPFSIRGTVARGEQLGAKLGFPTCNIELTHRRIPLHGIYACMVKTPRGEYPAAVSIGYRPTVTDSGKPVLEAHLLDFEGQLYGETIEVVFRQKIREEEKFASMDELQRQIAADVERIRRVFADAAF